MGPFGENCSRPFLSGFIVSPGCKILKWRKHNTNFMLGVLSAGVRSGPDFLLRSSLHLKKTLCHALMSLHTREASEGSISISMRRAGESGRLSIR